MKHERNISCAEACTHEFKIGMKIHGYDLLPRPEHSTCPFPLNTGLLIVFFVFLFVPFFFLFLNEGEG